MIWSQRVLVVCALLHALLAWGAGCRQGHVTAVRHLLALEAAAVPLACAVLAEFLRRQVGPDSSWRFSQPASFMAIVFALGYLGPILYGPPNPDTAAHLALFLYPVIQAAVFIAIYVVVTIYEEWFLKGTRQRLRRDGTPHIVK